MRSEFKVLWQQALDAEFKNLVDHDVFTWVPRPIGIPLIDSNYAWKVKSDDNGNVSKFKCRIVARGYNQTYGIHYFASMAPVAKLTTFRVLLAEAARRGMDVQFADVRSAYLEADIDVPNYMTPPKGIKPPVPGHVMRLDKTLYGTVQGARQWNTKINKNMLEDWGFQRSYADPCLYQTRRRHGDEGSVVR